MSFSVLVSIYWEEPVEIFDQALKSIWDQQSFKPCQIVLVQDGPLTANQIEKIQQWKSKLGQVLKVVSIPYNAGLGAALRVGLEACTCDIVARMDADDLAVPDRFEKQYEFLRQYRNIDILGSWVWEMTYSGTRLGVRRNPLSHDEILSGLWSCPVIHPSVMMRRSQVLKAGNYNAEYRRRQDYELWFRCAEAGLKFHNLPEPLLYYRFGKHTHKKQTPSLAWRQGVVGFRGSSRLGFPLYKRFACFLPFLRSLLPSSAQHLVYKILSPIDPRRRT